MIASNVKVLFLSVFPPSLSPKLLSLVDLVSFELHSGSFLKPPFHVFTAAIIEIGILPIAIVQLQSKSRHLIRPQLDLDLPAFCVPPLQLLLVVFEHIRSETLLHP